MNALWLLAAISCFNPCHGMRKFPEGFQFGVATASYQIEGAWNASDKSENIWDRFTHSSADKILDGSNGDVACDSYNNYRRDIEMLTELGVDFYRFSISWSRLIPNGYIVSEAGAKYYNDLIDGLLENGIEPVVTLYHWDLPQFLQDLGGWPNPLMVKHFVRYADISFGLFGDRVKVWLTFNEPQVFCTHGYGLGSKAPGIEMSGYADYLCGATVLKAHAKAYQLYGEKYRKVQNGRVGLTMNASWREPASNSAADQAAANRMIEFEFGWFAHPIFSKHGDYPYAFKKNINMMSRQQGFPESRLPSFTKEEVDEIRGSSDFLGLNHYTTYMVEDASLKNHSLPPSFDNDLLVKSYFKEEWQSSASAWLRTVPWGFRKILNWIKLNYDDPEVQIFENGYSDRDGTDDVNRLNYYRDYLNSLLDAIEDGCNITRFAAWSLMDNFEWNKGYSERFGIYYVNYTSQTKERIAKTSVALYKDIVKSRSV